MNDDNVTALPGLPDNPLKLAQRSPGYYCSHPAVVLDDHTRTIQCANTQCGAQLDAFDFLRTNAHTIDSAWRAYREVNRKVAEVSERVHVLKKEEQRLRAMIKRLQDKSGAVLITRGIDLP